MQPQRRSYSRSFKAQVIQECAQPGASIANVALSHSLNANLVHKWIRLQTQKSMALHPAFVSLPMPLAALTQRWRGWWPCSVRRSRTVLICLPTAAPIA
ncbi:transposase [Pseudomonas aeruginosa]|uniref:transposase n=1 Tax=Pseudomonas aeruginosa TaxID=287 RepID=UPI0020283194|nr:transposase [Pseudomonas aeruginosa]